MVFIAGILLILLTVGLHALFTTALIALMKGWGRQLIDRYGASVRPIILAVAACAIALKHSVDIVLWALAFWIFTGDQFSDFDETVYFSSVTYTSLGYGDVVISGRWRFLCSLEAINGMILFGLSAAILFAIVERLWRESAE